MAEIDHLVFVVPDLEAAIDRFERDLGVRPVVGGRHDGLGTWNALLALRSDAPPSYLELIAADPEQPDPPGPRPFGIDDDAGPRLATFAVRPSTDESIADVIETMRQHGHDPGDAVPMSRTTPDGELLAWQLTMPTSTARGLVPFVIDWGDTPMPANTIAVAAELVRTSASSASPDLHALFEALRPAGFDLGLATDEPLAATLRSGSRTIVL